MSRILLLGAGFSRNWGGWLAQEAFEYLLGCAEISGDPHLRTLLWRNQPTGGYEGALAELQAASNLPAVAAENKARLKILQKSVARMFDDMNKGYFSHARLEFQLSPQQRTVAWFLTKFDAIFTLNQDLLLEHLYFDKSVASLSNGRLSGAQMPGMQQLQQAEVENHKSWAQSTWVPTDPLNTGRATGLQPYYKLHGSSNWQSSDGGALLIMGGNKAHEIGLSPILRYYHDQFRQQLSAENTRLMVIGYGFKDPHINEAIADAVTKHQLKMFVIDPLGSDVARALNSTRIAAIPFHSDLEYVFEQSLIGASRRTLGEIFGNDKIEHNKVLRFFAN